MRSKKLVFNDLLINILAKHVFKLALKGKFIFKCKKNKKINFHISFQNLIDSSFNDFAIERFFLVIIDILESIHL